MSRTSSSLTHPRAWLAGLLLLIAGILPLAGCGGSSAGGNSLTIGLTYIPNIQFAPFYVAQSLGYYKAAGLDVTLRHHGANEDEFGALISGRENLIFAGGDETLQARSQGQDIVYVAEVFTKYPVGLIVPSDSPIQKVSDLKGHTVGIPGKFGATWIGLLALLSSAGLKQDDVNIQTVGFTQVQALVTKKVDAVMGYLNNEPIQLQKQGMAVRTIDVASAQPLISNGLAGLRSTLNAHPDQVKAFIAATLKAVDYSIAHPQEAVENSKADVPGLDNPTNAADALTVLKATLPLWEHTGKAGSSDPAAWKSMADFMQAQGLLTNSVGDVTKAYSNDYLS
jgi:putative riboflavin transport system substrate-binding protein